MQEAGAGVSTVTSDDSRVPVSATATEVRTAPSTTALHMLATCDPPLLRPVTCYAHPAVG